MDLVTGATGYIGGRLLVRLAREGRSVRALARDPSRLHAFAGVEGRSTARGRSPGGPFEAADVVRADLVAGTGLERALEGCETAYYLVHSMETGSNGAFGARDRAAARNFGRAAEVAGVERIVYLGGIIPQGSRVSAHLASRLEVEQILMASAPRTTVLRASIVVGARSSSFRILVRLVERLRLLPFPAWRDHLTQPIDERDAIEYLARAPQTPAVEGRSLDIAGPDVISYGAMIGQIAEQMGVARSALRLGLSQTPTASAVVAAIAGEPLELVRPLMQSLEYDLLPRDDTAEQLFGLRLHPFSRAVDHALREWEQTTELAAR